MSDEEIESNLGYSEYPICYDVSNTQERPKHSNWVIPSGTTVLVDFDHVVKRCIAEELQKRENDIRKRLGLPLEEES